MQLKIGITLVALVITIIILLILAGITLNLTIGDNGIIRKAIDAGQNYQNSAEYEQAILDELVKETDNRIGSIEKPDGGNDDRNPYESEFRRLVAEAITNEGVNTQVDDTDETFITNIGKILQERTKDATATKESIANGKTAWVNGEKITGTMSSSNSINLPFYLYVVQNESGGRSQYPIKNMDIKNYNTLSITGSFEDQGSSYMVISVDGVTLNKIEETVANVNLTYDISQYNNLTIQVYASYTRAVVANINVKLSI